MIWGREQLRQSLGREQFLSLKFPLGGFKIAPTNVLKNWNWTYRLQHALSSENMHKSARSGSIETITAHSKNTTQTMRSIVRLLKTADVKIDSGFYTGHLLSSVKSERKDLMSGSFNIYIPAIWNYTRHQLVYKQNTISTTFWSTAILDYTNSLHPAGNLKRNSIISYNNLIPVSWDEINTRLLLFWWLQTALCFTELYNSLKSWFGNCCQKFFYYILIFFSRTYPAETTQFSQVSFISFLCNFFHILPLFPFK